jgi:hypothetical protein
VADETTTVVQALRRLAYWIEAGGARVTSATGSVGNKKFDLVKRPGAVFDEWPATAANALYLVLSFREVPGGPAAAGPPAGEHPVPE